jgi:hypothetical protein
MATLDSKLRDQLDNVCKTARELAVGYARSALEKRAVDAAEPLPHFGPKEKELRNRLRARGRQVGDVRNNDGTQSIERLAQELAYEYWHRMLFARFLAENNLLMHPDGVAVSLAECEELAPTAEPPAVNGFVLAARYASTMLPQIFRTDDVLLEIEFAPEQRLTLERMLTSLPQKTFIADDSLGWAYQFWQTKENQNINKRVKSGEKVDGRNLPAVTQFFTEPYMVQFLLHNTIGAWWCGSHNIKGPAGSAGLPAGTFPVEMEFLRWSNDGTPAAGKFETWPQTLAEFTMLDPCCGSGHFLVAAFNLIVPLRMNDETLTAEKACEAVLRENIFGLELDSRCTQIAAFSLALAAWKYPNAGGYRPLPTLNIACSGQGVTGKKEEWLALANGNDRLREGMDRLYDIFVKAPQLGSLINPRRENGDLFEAGFSELQPLLGKVLANTEADADLSALGVAAQGIATAAEFLVSSYTLVMTNVPYLGRGAHGDELAEYGSTFQPNAKSDLATIFVARALEMASSTIAVVLPQNWWFLHSYLGFRKQILSHTTWNIAASLGEEAWQTFGMRGPRTVLLVASTHPPNSTHCFAGIDASSEQGGSIIRLEQKERILRGEPLQIDGRHRTLTLVNQLQQLCNPGGRVVIGETRIGKRLAEFVQAGEGCSTGDNDRFVRFFWELNDLGGNWISYAGGDGRSRPWYGREKVLMWENGTGELSRFPQARIQNTHLWKMEGILIGRIRGITSTLFSGGAFDKACVVLIPNTPELLPALYAFVVSGEYESLVRELDQKVAASTSVMTSVPFDEVRWKEMAVEEFPEGLPRKFTDDPTQLVFSGNIEGATDVLQVAVARLLGYHWPEQTSDAIDSLTDIDGILCLPGVRGKASASERLLEVLQAAYAKNWTDSVLHSLLMEAGCSVGATIEDWLRNLFFEQHCKRFQNRPFVWHIWDGRKDGFAALVNYHKLTHKTLENLTYSYLGDWINAQSKSDKAGADLRLGAAQALQEKLKLILEGESPYDIFVRWKPLHEQSIGWNPDLNDGVRMNIRPFMKADILRKKPNIKWTKDRGGEIERNKNEYPWFWSGSDSVEDRVNDIHLTNAEKQAARDRKKGIN